MLKQPPHDGEPSVKEYVTCQKELVNLNLVRQHILLPSHKTLIKTYDCIVTLVNIVGIDSKDGRAYVDFCQYGRGVILGFVVVKLDITLKSFR